jgi:hypothetical protein
LDLALTLAVGLAAGSLPMDALMLASAVALLWAAALGR